uniref:Testis-expressed sequence 12 protein-like protein n=1 Tax=Callorhinchus milii TaxID=7868 RepID=A0A4W3GTU6_CALMI
MCICIESDRVYCSYQKMSENKGTKRRKEIENEGPELTVQAKKHAASASDVTELFSNQRSVETIFQDINEAVNVILTAYTETLSERTAVNANHAHQLDKLLEDVRAMEIYLKQKKEDLRHKLTMIASALHTE